jgi:hypothetical protein
MIIAATANKTDQIGIFSVTYSLANRYVERALRRAASSARSFGRIFVVS